MRLIRADVERATSAGFAFQKSTDFDFQKWAGRILWFALIAGCFYFGLRLLDDGLLYHHSALRAPVKVGVSLWGSWFILAGLVIWVLPSQNNRLVWFTTWGALAFVLFTVPFVPKDSLLAWVFGFFSVSFGVVVLLVAFLFKTKDLSKFLDTYQKQQDEKKNIFGGGRFAEDGEASKHGFCHDIGAGLFLGFHHGKPLVYHGDQHGITIAPPRTGKLTTVIAQTLMTHHGSKVVIDIKGELSAVTARRQMELGHKVFILNPLGIVQNDLTERGFPKSACYNPLAFLDPESSMYLTDVRDIGAALIINNGGDSHWTDSARALIEARIMYLVECCPMEERTLRNVRAFLGWREDTLLEEITLMRQKGGFGVQNRIAKFMESTNEIKGIQSTADTQTQFLDDLLILDSLETSDFDFADLKRGPVVVYLVLPLRSLAAQARWLRLLLSSALGRLLTDEPGGRVLFLMDEFAQLGHLEIIEKTMCASAGLGVQLWPFLQSTDQLQDLYGKRWRGFLSTAGFAQFFRPGDLETAELISDWAGPKTAFNPSVGKDGEDGGGGYVGVPFYSAHHALGMAKNEQIIFAQGLQFPIMANRYPYWEVFKGWNPKPYDKNPYHPEGE